MDAGDIPPRGLQTFVRILITIHDAHSSHLPCVAHAAASHSSRTLTESSCTVDNYVRASAEGAELALGGYCKEYVKGQRPVGVMLEDTWLLKYVYTMFLLN